MRLLVFDMGSSSTRAAIFDGRGHAHRRTQQAYALRTTAKQAGELSPRQVLTAARVCFAGSGTGRFDMIGGCAFWHGLLGLDGKHRPITSIYTRADARSRADAARWRRQVNENRILQRTGCMLRFPSGRPSSTGCDEPTPLCPGECASGFRLPIGFSGASLANRDQLLDGERDRTLNQTTHRWDEELCAGARLRISQLPDVRDPLLPNVFCPIGDGAANNLGCGANAPGIAAINLGTSAALRVTFLRKTKVPFGLFRYLIDQERFVCGGAVSNAGNFFRALDPIGKKTSLQLLPERAHDFPESKDTMAASKKLSPSADLSALMADSFRRIARILHILEGSAGPIGSHYCLRLGKQIPPVSV